MTFCTHKCPQAVCRVTCTIVSILLLKAARGVSAHSSTQYTCVGTVSRPIPPWTRPQSLAFHTIPFTGYTARPARSRFGREQKHRESCIPVGALRPLTARCRLYRSSIKVKRLNHATVDHERRAVDIARGIRAEEGARADELMGHLCLVARHTRQRDPADAYA